MLKSMTAYSRVAGALSLGSCVIELQSVNKRHLEIQCQLPLSLSRYEASIRRQLGERLQRGQVMYRLRISYSGGSPTRLIPNIALLEQLKDVWQQMAPYLGYNASMPMPAELFADREDLFSQENIADFEEKALWEEIAALTHQALEILMQEKKREGQALGDEIMERQKSLCLSLLEAESLTVGAADRYRHRLIDKLQQLIAEPLLSDERMLREVCLYADKVDVSEEIARLRIHLQELAGLVVQKAASIGKQLEFLLQEISREISTLGAKSPDIAVTHHILAMKGEVEKIREQVQNIE